MTNNPFIFRIKKYNGLLSSNYSLIMFDHNDNVPTFNQKESKNEHGPYTSV